MLLAVPPNQRLCCRKQINVLCTKYKLGHCIEEQSSKPGEPETQQFDLNQVFYVMAWPGHNRISNFMR